jgi:hypothetical protein
MGSKNKLWKLISSEHIYLGGGPIEYQIKGDSNLYDMKLQ